MDVSIEDKVGHKSTEYELVRMCFVHFLMGCSFFLNERTLLMFVFRRKTFD